MEYTKKKFFITGITGFVGSHMTDKLLSEGVEKVYGLKRWRSRTENIKHLLESPRLELYEGDLLDFSSIFNALNSCKPDVIYHFAAQSFPGASYDRPIDTLNTNIIGTANLFEQIKIIRKMDPSFDPIVLSVSTSEVYGNPLEEELPIKETHPYRPANPYSISKVGHDLLSQYYYTAYGINVIITRMFSHEGIRRGKEFAISSFARQIALHEKLKKKPYIIKVGNLNSVRTYSHIDDAVNAYWLAIQYGKIGEIYNIGGQEHMKIGEMLEKLLALSTIQREEFVIWEDPLLLRPVDITLQIPSSEKFESHTGWKTKKHIDDICRDILNYWRIKEQ